jgi:hypothetical protein
MILIFDFFGLFEFKCNSEDKNLSFLGIEVYVYLYLNRILIFVIGYQKSCVEELKHIETNMMILNCG